MIAASPPNFSIELATGRVRPSADKPPSPGLRRAGGLLDPPITSGDLLRRAPGIRRAAG
jgi:hypothetical protein